LAHPLKTHRQNDTTITDSDILKIFILLLPGLSQFWACGRRPERTPALSVFQNLLCSLSVEPRVFGSIIAPTARYVKQHFY
jgi:hypothetical protein